jgi:hypothetical protein
VWPARLATAAGLAAGSLLIIVGLWGGFTIDAGPLHLSVHNWRPLLAVLVLSIAVLASTGRAQAQAALEAVAARVERHAAAIVVVVAAATTAVGVSCGTWAASGADASGYVSEARLLASGALEEVEPLATRVALPTGTWTFSPLGYRPGRTPGVLVPTYPAGLPLTMAPVMWAWGDAGAYVVVPLLGGIGVLATFGLGVAFGSRMAGLVAATLLATSPVFMLQLVQPMSDVAVTAWWALALALACAERPGAPLFAGVVASLAVATRPNLLPMAILPAVLCARGRQEPGGAARAVWFGIGLLPGVVGVFWLQARLFGSAFSSGYGSASDLYSMASIGPNAAAYARRIVHGEPAALTLLLLALLASVFRTRGDAAVPLATPSRAPRVRTAVWLAAAALGVMLASYLPYFQFPEWSYLRFLLPAWPAALVALGLLVSRALHVLPRWSSGTVLLLVLVTAASWNVRVAAGEQAFAIRRYEARYRMAGRYLDAAVSPAAVIVTVQESGSVRYYTRRPILRWDQLGPDLDAAVAAVQQQGRHPLLLVEDWEAPEMKQRFPASTLATLDWPPRAEFGEEVRVRLFDPADRQAPRSWPADRVH